MKNILILSALLLVFIGCNKEEGEGGTSSIIGKVEVDNYNSNGEYKSTYYGADEDVYIIYGTNNTIISDKTTTSFDGSYRFDYLTPGDYQVFAYSDCDSCNGNQVEVLVSVTISDKKQVVTASDLKVNR